MSIELNKKYTLKEMSDTQNFAHEFCDFLFSQFSSQKDENGAIVILLSGELGSGKTTFSQAIGKCLSVTENMISPTFILMKRYQTNNSVIKNLVHIDAYRLEKKEELEKIGWEEIISENNSLILLEWPEKVEGIMLPQNTVRVELKHMEEGVRGATIITN